MRRCYVTFETLGAIGFVADSLPSVYLSLDGNHYVESYVNDYTITIRYSQRVSDNRLRKIAEIQWTPPVAEAAVLDFFIANGYAPALRYRREKRLHCLLDVLNA